MIEVIKNTVENTLNVSFEDESRKREVFEARVVFCLIYLGNYEGNKIPKNQSIADIIGKTQDVVVYYKKQAKSLMIYKEFKSKYIKCLRSIGKNEEEISLQTSVKFIEEITKKRK